MFLFVIKNKTPCGKISGKGNFIFGIIRYILRKKIKKTVSLLFFVILIKKIGL